ncbi:MAG: glycosyltransferase family 4 protein [Bacteroidia bacterium]
MMPVRILVISNYSDFHATRPEAAIFIALAKRGFEVHIMTRPNSPHREAFEQAGIQVIDFHPEKKWDKAEIQRIRDFILEKQIDIMQLFNSKSIVNGIKAAKGLPVKVVLYRGYAGNIHWYDPFAYTKYLHPRVDAVVCNSVGVRDYLQSIPGFKKEKAISINKGHDTDWYVSGNRYDIRAELGLPENAFLVVNVANNRRMKGIPWLLKAMNIIPANLPVHLLLIGKGMDNRQNLRIVRAVGNEGRIHFAGFRNNVLDILPSCDLFALSSIKGESITKAVIEAMSLAVAPIITNIPGNVELVEHGISGLVVPAKDEEAMASAILKCYHEPDFREKLGFGAQKHIQTRLNTERTVNEYVQFYDGLLDRDL